MICILGGTFDPVHFGHLRPALEVQQALGIRQVRLLPCRVPPHRESPGLSAEHRLELLQQVVEREPALAVDDRELRREGPSYMVDTLRSLREENGDQPLCLALGMDAFLGLKSWHRWQELRQLCHLVVMQRPGSQWPLRGSLAEWLEQARVTDAGLLRHKSAGSVLAVTVTQLSISSTRIRQLIAAGDSPRYLLPETVLDRIKQENWYAN